MVCHVLWPSKQCMKPIGTLIQILKTVIWLDRDDGKGCSERGIWQMRSYREQTAVTLQIYLAAMYVMFVSVIYIWALYQSLMRCTVNFFFDTNMPIVVKHLGTNKVQLEVVWFSQTFSFFCQPLVIYICENC